MYIPFKQKYNSSCQNSSYFIFNITLKISNTINNTFKMRTQVLFKY